jgi:hypothetical protein
MLTTNNLTKTIQKKVNKKHGTNREYCNKVAKELHHL